MCWMKPRSTAEQKHINFDVCSTGMNSFEKNFTAELEKCASKGTADLDILTHWNPSKYAPPEIHVAKGRAVHVPIESIHYQLRRSDFFQQVSNILGMTLSESLLENIQKLPLDKEKIQVWLFARWWFSIYTEYLLDPLFMRSKFYKERHDEFLTLMRHMLEFVGTRRLTFRAALAAWYPESEVLTTEAQSEDDDESDAEMTPSPPPAPIAPSVDVVVSPQPAAAAPAPAPCAPLPSARRLVLKGWGGREGRSRTRKNLSS